MKQVLITEEQIHQLVSRANAEITGTMVNEETIDPITGLRYTAHVYNVMCAVCDHLFNKEKENV